MFCTFINIIMLSIGRQGYVVLQNSTPDTNSNPASKVKRDIIHGFLPHY